MMSEKQCSTCGFWEHDTTLFGCCFSDEVKSRIYNCTSHPITKSDFGCFHWKAKVKVKFHPDTFGAVAETLHTIIFGLSWPRATMLLKTLAYDELPKEERVRLLADAKEILKTIAEAEK
jgi:hypothetical protein